ncbi:MAG TPA: DUF4349 domain-containing protein [Candidatus Deferrimicrobium sp.]|nr:DUF4349 domain-containing protein [Candidatus Deferrimicrobium sp.]
MKKLLMVLLVFVITAGGCGAEKNSSVGSVVGKSQTSQNMAAEPAKVSAEQADTARTPGGTPAAPAGEAYQRKVIQNRDTLLLVDNVRESVAKVQDKVQASGGFVAELNLTDTEKVSANLTLRVPAQGLADFSKFLSGLGNVRTDNLRTEDITGAFYDTEARLNNQKVQEKRLLELLGQAKNMDDILKLEAEISKTREQIEVLQGQINRWNQQVDLATIHLVLQTKEQVGSNAYWEPLGMRSALTGAKNGVLVTLKGIYHILSWIVVILGYVAPLLLVGLPVGYLLWRKRRNKSM